MRILYLLCVLWVASTDAMAQNEWPVATLISNPFSETERFEVPLAGSFLIGISVAHTSAEISSSATLLFVKVRQSSDAGKSICVTIDKRDGTYEAQNEYRIPDRIAAPFVQIPIPTKLSRHYASLTKDTLTVLAEMGSCDNKRKNTFGLAFWGQPEASPSTIVVAVNAGGMPTSWKRSPAGTETKCFPVQAKSSKSFDTLCELRFDQSERQLDFQLVRVVDGARKSSPPFTINLGSNN